MKPRTITGLPPLQEQTESAILLAVGLNHKSASEELRDSLAVSPDQLEDALLALEESLGSGVILSTCNRTELYFLASSAQEGVNSATAFLSNYNHIEPTEIFPHLYIHEAQDAVQHLLRVASSLDSMVLGEAQILGQVRDAFQASNRLGLCKGPLGRMFHAALKTGKRARTETAVGRNAVSVSSTAVELAKTVFPDLHGLRGMVLGIGDAGRLAAQALKGAGLRELLLSNRTYGKAAEVASAIGGVPVPFGRIGSVIGGVDIVITATSRPTYVLLPQMVEEARMSSHGPLVIIDIAVPGDVDPEVGSLPGVTLYTIADIEAAAQANMGERQVEAVGVEAIVAEETEAFMEWLGFQELVPTVSALQRHAEAIREREVAHLLKRLGSLSDDEQESLIAFSHAMVKKLLHEPITSLRQMNHPFYAHAVRELFALEGSAQANNRLKEERSL